MSSTRKKNRVYVAAASFLYFLLSGLVAFCQNQQATPAQTSSSTIRSAAQEVVLDMVFRDKKGRTIHDVRPEEIHVFEDGAEQKVTSFRLLEGKAALSSASPAGAESSPRPLDPMREVRLVTLVFEQLDQEGKRFFRQALKDILDLAPEQNLYFSVLVIDQSLHCIQPFTADHSALLKSVDKSAMWSFIQYQSQSAEIKEELRRTLAQGDSEQQMVAASGAGINPAQVQSYVARRMAQMQYDMLEAADTADREYNARATIDALMALVRAQSELPGRKVVLYFNPSLFIPEMVKEQYSNLVSMANRGNISFYTVDPKGLVALADSGGGRVGNAVTWSQDSEGRRELTGATGEIRAQQLAGGVGEVSPSQARAAENAENALRANSLLWLRDLAQQTGGATIAETNDYKAPLRIAMEEVRTYYEVAYAPHISVYDGKFRKISVRVDRPDVVVHTRSGYFALPQLKTGQQLLAYEMPLLNALTADSTPNDITFQAAAERFNDRGPKVEYMLTLEAPLNGLTFSPNPDHKSASMDAALLAVLRNSSGEIIDKFSKDFAVQVALDKVAAYKAGNLLQTFRTELAPGDYALEAVVMDRNANRIGVKKSAIKVPEPSNRLSISDIVLIRRTDPLKENQMLDAFYFPGGKVVPTLTGTLKGGPGNVLPFYFSVYPDRSQKDAVKLTMSFFKAGQYLGAAEAPLPEPQPDGRIPYIANLPADKFTPGNYEIRIGVTQGSSKVEENVDFQVD
jgi:VWFA-related protein